MGPVETLIVPGSLTLETPDPKVATYKIGLVGRAAAIFGVDEVVVYEDPAHKQGRQVSRVLEYQATAPYLRKKLFPLSDDLRHVGVLPPLNLPGHLVPAWVDTGQVRMGTMAGKRVDVGLEELADLDLEEDHKPPEPGEQFPVKVTAARADRVLVTPYAPDPDEFLGYTVHRAPSLSTAVQQAGPVLGTSREGEPLDPSHVTDGLALVFGTPEKGLEALLGEPSFPLVNTIPGQHTRSVRVEEAVLVSLGRLNGISSLTPGGEEGSKG